MYICCKTALMSNEAWIHGERRFTQSREYERDGNRSLRVVLVYVVCFVSFLFFVGYEKWSSHEKSKKNVCRTWKFRGKSIVGVFGSRRFPFEYFLLAHTERKVKWNSYRLEHVNNMTMTKAFLGISTSSHTLEWKANFVVVKILRQERISSADAVVMCFMLSFRWEWWWYENKKPRRGKNVLPFALLCWLLRPNFFLCSSFFSATFHRFLSLARFCSGWMKVPWNE